MSFSGLIRDGVYLRYSDCRKLTCGLSWDPDSNISKPVDLDLCYAVYDEFGRLLNVVSGKDGIRSNEAGSFYHSGDEIDGAYEDDDERLSLDLFSIPNNIHYVFLMVDIASDHRFGNVVNPSIRLEKGLERTEMATLGLFSDQGQEAKRYIFARLDRKPGGWIVQIINKFIESNDTDWEDTLLDYIPPSALEKKEQASLPPLPKKGEIVPLYYSRKARERVHCGLSWDADAANMDDTPDLDLTCLIFDEQGRYLDAVSSDAERSIDESGAVYHTGDDNTGRGDGDDEAIYVELARLPADVAQIVFVVDLKTRHTLEQVKNAALRIADSMTDLNQLSIKIVGGRTKDAFIFARLVLKDGVWMLHHIGEAVETAQIEDWAQGVRPYLI